MASVTHLSASGPLEQSATLTKFVEGAGALVVYGAEWCGPCKSFDPILEKYAAGEGALPVLHVDVDRAESLSEKIESVPTTHLYRNGRKVAEMRGATNLRALRAWIADEGAKP